MRRHFPARVLTIVFLALTVLGVCFAQQTTGILQGLVTDQTKGVLPGVELELKNVSTNVTVRQTTDDQGAYIFNFVNPGIYQLRASLPGFKTAEASNVLVAVARSTVVNLTLETGEISETVEVVAGEDQVNTKSAALSANMTQRQILDLPWSGRNALEVAELIPGVSVDSGALTGGNQIMSREGVGANVNGARRQQNSFYLDGSDNSGGFRNLGLQTPNPEAVQEVQVSVSTNTAEYGKQPGGYFNVITKSGTNQFRGSAFYVGQDKRLNANSWSRNRGRLPRDPANRKQFGGTLGGPIVKDKTFFFASLQQYRDSDTQTFTNLRFPTQKMFAGDFSEYTGQLYNPETNQPIPGNNLAAAGLLDPVAVNIAKSGLIPTVAKLGDRLVWDFLNEPVNNEILGKIDHNFNTAHQLQFSFFQTWGQDRVRGSDIPDWSRGFRSAHQNTTSGRHTWMLRSTLIVESRFSRTDLYTEQDSDDDVTGKDWSDFGAIWPIPFEGASKYRPWMEIRDGFNGRTFPRSTFDQKNYRPGSTVSWVRGSHNLKFGYEAQRQVVSEFGQKVSNGFRFQGRFSNRKSSSFPSVPNALFSHSMADFMMGRIENYIAQGALDYEVSAWSHYGFIQDQWRVTRKVTITPGLRYELYSAWNEKDGKASAFVENHRSSRFPTAPLHIAFQGDQGIPEGFVDPDRNNFAPRIGAAYDVLGNGKMAVRGGYGLYFAYPGAQLRVWTSSEGAMLAQAQGQEARLYDPWGTSKIPVFSAPPTPFASDINEHLKTYSWPLPAPRSIGISPDFTTPMSHQWNFSVENEVMKGITLTAAYVGNRGRKLLQTLSLNYARFINTPSGEPPNDNAANIQARVPYPTLDRFSIIGESVGISNFDAFQLSTRINLHGLTANGYYQYASSFGDGGGAFGRPDEDPEAFTIQTNNAADPRGEYGRLSRKHAFRMFYIYDLPFFPNHSRWTGKVLGGWQVSGNTSIWGGSPFDVILGYDANHDGITSRPKDRPDLVAPIVYTKGTTTEKMGRFFSPESFAKPVITADKLMGSLPRNHLIGPKSWGSSAALVKNFQINETMRAQVRMEFYNLFNHPTIGNPNGQMNSADFGKITSKSGNRTAQYTLKFYF